MGCDTMIPFFQKEKQSGIWDHQFIREAKEVVKKENVLNYKYSAYIP